MEKHTEQQIFENRKFINAVREVLGLPPLPIREPKVAKPT